MTDASDDDKPGYGRPPRKHQFRKGQSGNPKGRPKGAKNKLPRGGLDKLVEILRKEVNREIKVTEGERRVTVPMIQAVMRSVAVKAGKGSVPAQRLFLEMAFDVEGLVDQRQAELLDTVVHYKIGWQELFEEFDEANRPRPDVLPHPDDLHIDPETGEVFVLGPLTKEQRDHENARLRSICQEEIAAFKKEVEELKEYLAASELPVERSIVEKDIGFAKEAIRRFQKILRNMKGRFRIICLLSPDSTGNPFKIEQC